MFKFSKKPICLFLIFIMIFLVSSCKKEVTKIPVADGEKPLYGQNINLFSYYPDTLNPFLTEIRENYDIMSLVYEPLFAVRERGEEEPCLASAYKFENGGLTVRVMLKDNVKFHSGAVFGADDVIFTLKYIAEYAPNFLYIFDNIKGYSKDGNDVVFNLKSLQFNFVSCLDFPIISKSTDIKSFNENAHYQPNGCGAFEFDANAFKQKEMRLVKNTEYYNPDFPYADSITVKLLKNSPVAVSAFNGNEVSAITSDEFVWGDVSFTNDFTVSEYGGDWFYFLAFNYENALLCDVNVRRMMLSMIDRDDMVQKVFQTHAYATNSILNPMYNYGMVYTDEFDLDNTAGYAKDAGLTDKDKNGIYEKTVDDEVFSLSFSVLADADDDKIMKIADILAQSAKKAKISLNIKRLSGEDYQTAFAEKDYDILLTKEKIRCCDNLASKLDFNGKYEVPYEIYTELANILNGADTENANEKMREFNNLYISLAPCIALCYDSYATLCHGSVKNFTVWRNSRYRGILQSFIKY